MGNIDLQHELMINKKLGIIGRRSGRECNCVRRVYSAKIDGRNTDLTLAMYEGDGAEEQHVKMYMSLRHPNIVQMYGTARSGAMYATIFHGDLIPIRQFVASASPIITVYIYACHAGEWKVLALNIAGHQVLTRSYGTQNTCDYMRQQLPDFGRSSNARLKMYSTLSIRRSNGRLCVDLLPHPDGKNEGSNLFYHSYPREYHPSVNPSLDPTRQEAAAIHSLTFQEYHYLRNDFFRSCRRSFPKRPA
ncbi:hypothetical protein C8F04DRAFT_165062 [Mycena alexandri]|uniref:Protein kinase domain-containing protein n=1 Tax=Mycena alexandri TaxID=1745969 RepID=A0AAD6WTC1_9AGAR|nr:hypothetical protein C8F04DRAFT_165062 [Mycena alexandri]